MSGAICCFVQSSAAEETAEVFVPVAIVSFTGHGGILLGSGFHGGVVGLFIEGDGQRQLPAAADDGNLGGVPCLVVPQGAGQVGSGGDLVIVHRGDQILGLDTGLVRAAARRHVHDVCAVRGQAELGGSFLVVVLHGDAHVSAGDIAVVNEIGDNAHHVINGDGEADALDGRAGIGGAGILGSGDADDLAVHVEQRAAGVTGVDGRVGLQHTDNGIVGGDLPVDAADIAHGLRGSQTAKGIADGNRDPEQWKTGSYPGIGIGGIRTWQKQ